MPVKSPIETEVIRKVTWRLVPFLMLAYFIAFVDRVNSGFAALQMNQDLGLTKAAFGLGARHLLYLLCPLRGAEQSGAGEGRRAALDRAHHGDLGHRLGRLMALVVGPLFLLCCARSCSAQPRPGSFPGVILYLTYWFPAEYRGRIVALFMVAIPVSSLIGSPISAALLQTDGLLGLHGWQWMFILEAIPAVLLGIACLFVLPDRPGASAVADRGPTRVAGRRSWHKRRRARTAPHMSLWQIMTNKYVLILALVYAGSSGVSQALSLWQPQISKSFGLTNIQVGLLNGIPFAVASVAMICGAGVLTGFASASGTPRCRSDSRLWRWPAPSFATTVAPFIVILCLILVGTYALKGPFFALSSEWLAGTAAAAGLAQINALGNLAGFVDSFLIGAIQGATGSYALALLPLVLIAAVGRGGRAAARQAGSRVRTTAAALSLQ